MKNFTILMIQEQYWSDYTKSSLTHPAWMLFEPTGTTPDRQPRSVIYVNRKSFTAAQITQLPVPSSDVTAIQIKLQGASKPSLFINIYNPCDDSALPALQQYFQQSLPHQYDLIIMAGDFNCHHPMWNPPRYTRHDEEADKLIDLATDLGLNLLIPPGTVTFPDAETAIDLVWANEMASARMMKCGIADNHDQTSDHLAIETWLAGEVENAPEIPSFNYDKTDWEKFNKIIQELLPQIPHPTTLWSPAAIDRYTGQITTVLTKAVEETTPYRKPCPHSKRWWTPELDELRRQANKQRNLYRHTRSAIDKKAWEEKAREHTEGIIKAQRTKWKEYVENADGKSIYKIKNYAFNKATSSLIPTLDGQAATQEDKVNTLTKAFFPRPPPANLSDITQTDDYPPPAPYGPSITIEQIQAAVHRAAPKKAPGPDGISNRVIREALPHIERHIQALMQASLDMGYFPKAFRTSTTVVLRKPDKPDYTKSKAYRPVALENTLGKILESVMATMISYLTETHELLPKEHYGARPGRSTEDPAMILSERIHKAWKEGKIFTAVFLDVAGAFNNVHHGRLLHNLRTRRIPATITRWVQSFLTDRTTCLQFNGAISDKIAVPAGVPQGSPLSPLLYLYYNAGALEVTEGHNGALGMGFVDDIVYGVEGRKDKGNVQKLKRILDKAEEWRKRHGVQFETSKYVLVHFTRNHRLSTDAPITVGTTTIQPSTEARYLGIIFDQQLRYKSHLQRVIKKGTSAALALSSIANCKWGTTHKLVRQLFQAVIAPRMDYAAVIWHRPKADGSTAHSMQARKLSTVQRIAMKTILGCYRTTPTVAMEIESGLPPPWLRLQTKVLSAITRMQTLATNHPIHGFLTEGLRTRTADVKHRSNIENILQQFPITTTGTLGAISPYTRAPWCPAADAQLQETPDNGKHAAHMEKHSRIKEIKAAAHEQWTDLNSAGPPSRIKRILQRDGNQHGPTLYNKLSRNTSAKIIQLRTGHCGLNSYLHRFNLADSPFCDCGTGQETVEHFLLECPLYREQRTKLRNNAGTTNMRVDALLGTSEVILKCTEGFINDTERI